VASILEVERLAFGAWPAAEVEALGGWRLRAMGSVTRRANSVWPGPDAGSPRELEPSVSRAEAFYAARGLPARFQLFPGAAPESLEPALAERGYEIEAPVSVQIASAEAVAAAPAAPEVVAEATDAASPAWWSVAGERSRFASAQEAYRGLLARLGGRACYALACRGGEPVATGLLVVEGSWGGIFSMLTLPGARRLGAGRALLAALARSALRRGAERLYLQVERENRAALALYAGAGFDELYGYHYRRAPARSGPAPGG
jgi:ribosomal protein S18 acetylase RimI-like enzyme